MQEIDTQAVYQSIQVMRGEIDTLYSLTYFLCWLVGLMCFLVVGQICIKLVVLGRTMAIGRRVETLLTLTERHGKSTDDRTREIGDCAREVVRAVAPIAHSAPALHAATAEVVQKVDEVPARVIEAIKEEKKKTDSQHD